MDQGVTRRFPWRHRLPEAPIVDGTSAKPGGERDAVPGHHDNPCPRRGVARDPGPAVNAVDELLTLAVEGHGGLHRWSQVSRFRAAVSIWGAVWTLAGKPGLLDNVVLEGATREQRLTMAPFPQPGCYTTWQPDRLTIRTTAGVVVAERRDPAAAFTAAPCRSTWDEFQVACFASEANWNYFAAPFVFTRGDFATEETWPWREDGQMWRTLLVTYPDTVAAHSRQQTCYFDDAGLLRRLDYTVDILGGGAAVHYPSRYREFDGIMIPTRRRVYDRDPTAVRSWTPSRSRSTSATSTSIEAPCTGSHSPRSKLARPGRCQPRADSARRKSRRDLTSSLPNTLRMCHSTVRALRNS